MAKRSPSPAVSAAAPSPAAGAAAAGSPVATLRADVYARVTDRIVEDLARVVRPWAKPWAVAPGQERARITLPLRSSGTPYRGVNVMLLWGAALDRGFSAPMWMTYRRAQELGGQVRKGESGTSLLPCQSTTYESAVFAKLRSIARAKVVEAALRERG